MPSAVRDWILPPREGGPFGRHVVPYILLAMEQQLLLVQACLRQLSGRLSMCALTQGWKEGTGSSTHTTTQRPPAPHP